jgi:dTDP-4-amino-4,6-dideoxygalactose transaminase
LALFSNGTLGLVTALQVLRVTREVIITPYSFVATAHSGIGCRQKSGQISSA